MPGGGSETPGTPGSVKAAARQVLQLGHSDVYKSQAASRSTSIPISPQANTAAAASGSAGRAGAGGSGTASGPPTGTSAPGRRMGSTALVDKLLQLMASPGDAGPNRSASAGASASGNGGGIGRPVSGRAAGGKRLQPGGSPAGSSGSNSASERAMNSTSPSPCASPAGSARATAASGAGGSASGSAGAHSASGSGMSRAGRSHSATVVSEGGGDRGEGLIGIIEFEGMRDALDSLTNALMSPKQVASGAAKISQQWQQQQPGGQGSARDLGEAGGSASAASPEAPRKARFDVDSDEDEEDDGMARCAAYKRAHTANLAGVHVAPVLVTTPFGALATKSQMQQQQEKAAAAAPGPPVSAFAMDAQHGRATHPTPVPSGPAGAAVGAALLCVSPTLPPSMSRVHWRLADFKKLDVVYEGHASSVYKVPVGAAAGV